MRQFLISRLSPFRHKSFRYFFFVQTLSLVGTWSHELARAWLAIELLENATAIGSVMLAAAIPSLLLILNAGVLVDRIEVRKLMITTKLLLSALAFGLAFLIEVTEVQFWYLLLFSFFEGCIIAFDLPAYQALTVRLVPRSDFQQALALNSTNFHMARMLGPLVAGLLMAFSGPSLVFLFDGCSYLLLVLVLRKIDLRQAQRNVDVVPRNGLKALFEGFYYMSKNPNLRYALSQLFLTICTIFPLNMVIFRAYLQQKFSLNAEQFGYLFTFPALGSMLGALSFAGFKPEKPMRALWYGVPFGALSIYLVPTLSSPTVTAFVMGLAGFFSYLSFASLTVTVHLEVQEEYRGRMGSLIGLCFVAIGPLMGFPLGAYADGVGHSFAIHSLAILFAALSALLGLIHRHQQKGRAQRQSVLYEGPTKEENYVRDRDL